MVQLHFCGHSCFFIQGEKARIIVDPWLRGNPQALIDPGKIKVDAVLVSHGHYDHLGDALEISEQCQAPIIGTAELVTYCAKKGAKTHRMHIGGAHDFGDFWLKLTPAWHGSSNLDENNYYLGMPCGFLIKIDGKIIYHAGDTGLFGDMKFVIGDRYKLDVALLPIGDNVVMGPEDAVAAVQWLNPKLVIPMHYNTFPLIKQDPQQFKDQMDKLGFNCKILKPGDSILL